MALAKAAYELGEAGVKTGLKAVKKAAPDIITGLRKSINEAVGNKTFAPQSADVLFRSIDEDAAEAVPIKQMWDGFQKGDATLKSNLDSFLHEKGFELDQANKGVAEGVQRAELSGKVVDSKSLEINKVQEDFTVAEEFRSKGAQDLSPEQIDSQFKNAETAWKEAEGLAPGSEDLSSRQMTMGPIDSTDVKGWVKSQMGKYKSGLLREGGAGTYLDKKGYPRPTVDDMPFFELHHELMKSLYSSYMLQVKALYQAGSITKLDVINFNHLAKESGGFGMGDYGVVGYPRAVHQRGHSVLRLDKIEPTGKALTGKVETITKFDNINDLTADFQKSLQEISLPMRRQLNLSQRAYDAIPVWDQKKIFQLFRVRDNFKKGLKDSVLPDFEASGIKPPSKGGGVDLLEALRKKGGTPSQRTLEIENKVNEARKTAQDYLEEVKGRIAEQEGKDIEMDLIRSNLQEREGKGIIPSELQQGSYRESVEGTPLRGKEADAAPKTTAEAQENIRMIRELIKKKGSITEKDLNKLLNKRAKENV